jgi:hypothetical protein
MKLTVFLLFFYFLHLENFACTQFEIIETNTQELIEGLHYFNGETIIIGGDNYIAKFVDDELTILDNSFFPEENVIHSFNRIDTNTAFLVSSYPSLGNGSYYIFKTNDNCETWSLVFDTTNLRISKLTMFDSLEGLFFSTYYSMYRTIDGCHNVDYEMAPQMSSTAVAKFNDSIICLGTIQRFTISYDRGRTWNSRSFIMQAPTSFDFISLDTIVATANGYFAKSFNNGVTWTEKYIGDYLSKITHLEDNTLFMVGGKTFYDSLWTEINHGLIFKSYDLGETWQTFNTGLSTRFLNMEIINDSVALISGTNGVLIKYFYRDHNLGFEDLTSEESNFTIYPNPTSNMQQIQISSIGNDNVNITLFDILGNEVKPVFNGQIQEGITKIDCNLSNLPTGLYVYRIVNGKNINFIKSQKY